MKRINKILFTDDQGHELIEITSTGQLHFIKAFYNANEIGELIDAVVNAGDEMHSAARLLKRCQLADSKPAEAAEAGAT